nr:hypothetical protein [Alkalisalibacterium limincola]
MRAQLQLQLRTALLDRLGIGVGGDELHPLDRAGDHVRDGVAAATAHADHLDDRVGGYFFDQFVLCHVLNPPVLLPVRWFSMSLRRICFCCSPLCR